MFGIHGLLALDPQNDSNIDTEPPAKAGDQQAKHVSNIVREDNNNDIIIITGNMAFCPESVLHNPVLTLDDESKRPAIESLVKSFLLTPDQARELKGIFVQEMEHGLSVDAAERKNSCLLMENTFMTRLPRGRESGDFLSLDLGSTNFRVILSRLKGTGKPEDDDFRVKYYDVPLDLRVGESAKPLFLFLAECIQDFVNLVPDLKGKKLPLGFSFSYPMVQQSVDSGFLVTWTKSYDLPDAVGADAVTFLREAIATQKVCLCVSASGLPDVCGSVFVSTDTQENTSARLITFVFD